MFALISSGNVTHQKGNGERDKGGREKARRGDSSSLYDCNTHTKLSVIVGSLTNSIQEELVALMLCQNNGSALNHKMFKIYDYDVIICHFEGEKIDTVEAT